MKNPFWKRLGFHMVADVLLLSTIILLLLGSAGFQRDGPTVSSVIYLDQVQVSVNGGPWEETTLPHKFRNLEPRTPVSVRTTITPEFYDGVYIKPVYSPAKVYLDGELVFEFGKRENYPTFMKDPATEIHVVETFGTGAEMRLQVDFLSPKTRNSLMVHPMMLGTAKELILERAHQFGIPLIFALVQIIAGISMILISACICLIDSKGSLFLWLGLSSLATGLWAFGENNFSVLIFRSSTLLYLLSFIGMFTFIVPLLHFIRSCVEFENPKPIQQMETFFVWAATVALVLQLLGVVACSQSMFFFHLTLPLALIATMVLTVLEYLRYDNRSARRFLLPIGILTGTALLELFNYQLPFTYVFSSLFQLGILVFLLIMGITAGVYIKDSIRLKKAEQKLAYEKNLLNLQTEDQKESRLWIAHNEQVLSRQRHDLRHHLTVIQELAGDNPELQEYLSTMMELIPKAKERFCENNIVNAVISHFATLCEKQGITFTHRITVPETGNSEIDSNLCAIFSNLLENAIEACDRMENGEKFIRINTTVQYSLLTITMDNSFNGEFLVTENRFRSSKRNDYGIGISSIKSIAQECHGDAHFKVKDRVFLSNVYLRIKP